jgi:hypothetical protein
MNYITNYYKNLSEQLQAQVNHLEREVRMINEAIAAGTMAPSAQSMAQAGRPEATNPGYDPQMLAALLAAYGQNSSQFDYNRDGVVDGADLGILLGGQAGGNPLTQRSTQYGTALGGQSVSGAGMRRPTQAGGGRFNPTASMGGANAFANAGRPTQGGGSPFTGDINGDGVVDGADLGLALGGQGGGNYQGVLQNWGMAGSVQSPNQSLPRTQQRRPRRTVR